MLINAPLYNHKTWVIIVFEFEARRTVLSFALHFLLSKYTPWCRLDDNRSVEMVRPPHHLLFSQNHWISSFYNFIKIHFIHYFFQTLTFFLLGSLRPKTVIEIIQLSRSFIDLLKSYTFKSRVQYVRLVEYIINLHFYTSLKHNICINDV